MNRNRIIRAAAVLPLAAATAVGAGAASAATGQDPPLNGDFAGYQVGGEGSGFVVHSATARWVQPKATPHGFRNRYSEAVVGLNDPDGPGVQQDMAQVGTEADSIGGKPRYYAWYTPRNGGLTCAGAGNCQQVRFKNSVKPGDHLSASISVRGSQTTDAHVTMTLTDTRYRRHLPPLRWTHTVRFTQNTEIEGTTIGASIPDNSGDIVPLADFGTVRFNSATVNGEVIGGYEGTELTQWNYNDGSGVLASSSAITGRGGDFTVTWKRAGG